MIQNLIKIQVAFKILYNKVPDENRKYSVMSIVFEVV